MTERQSQAELLYPIEMWPTQVGHKDVPTLQRRLIIGAARAAEATAESGELVIRRGALVGRILFVDGKVAWIHCHGQHGYFTDLISQRAGIAQEELITFLATCRDKKIPLGEALVAAGRINEAELHQMLLENMQVQFTLLLDHPESVALLFLPVKRSYSGDTLFTIDDVLGEERGKQADSSSQGPSRIVTLLATRLANIAGAVGCGAVVTAEGCSIDFHTHIAAMANPAEADAVKTYAARMANQVALAVDVSAAFTAVESIHVARAHYIYERRLATVSVFMMARANEPIGMFMAAARAATRDLLS